LQAWDAGTAKAFVATNKKASESFFMQDVIFEQPQFVNNDYLTPDKLRIVDQGRKLAMLETALESAFKYILRSPECSAKHDVLKQIHGLRQAAKR
jgi:hypothetical protein